MAPAARPPPELRGEEEVPKLHLWMSGKRSEGCVAQDDGGTGLSLSQSTQYSVLARRDGWLQLRDELSQDVFYLNTVSRKTCWGSQKTPFRGEPRDPDALSLRDKKIHHFRSLLRRHRVPPREQPPPSVGDTDDDDGDDHRHRHHTLSRGGHGSFSGGPGSPLPSQVGGPPRSAPIGSPGSPAAPATPGGVIAAASEAASFRQHLSVFCPYTGNAFPAGQFAGGLAVRRRVVGEILLQHGVSDVAPAEPDFDFSDSREEYNVASRGCFQTFMQSALCAVRESGGERAVRRLDTSLQQAFEELAPAPGGGGGGGGSFGDTQYRCPSPRRPGGGTGVSARYTPSRGFGGGSGMASTPSATPERPFGGGGAVEAPPVFPLAGDYVFLCNPSLSGMPERAYGPPGQVTSSYPLTGYCAVVWDEGVTATHKYPEEIILA